MKTLLNDKTTILLCIIGAICATVLGAMDAVEGESALNAILMALGIGGGRQVVAGIQKAIPPGS